jgi:hypothetical protein
MEQCKIFLWFKSGEEINLTKLQVEKIIDTVKLEISSLISIKEVEE